MSDQEYVDITFDGVEVFTEKAAKFKIENEEYWIPFSQIEDGDKTVKHHAIKAEPGESITVAIKEWLAVKNELI